MHLAKGCDVKVFEKGPYSRGKFNELASSLGGAGVYNNDADDSEQVLCGRGY